MTKKLQHGQRIVTYRWTRYDQYRHGEQYLHPEITISYGSVRDPLAEYSRSGEEYYLQRAKKIRDATGDTLYVDTDHGLSGSFSVRWQTNQEDGGPRGYHYVPCYAAKVSECGFDTEIIALVAKLAKTCEAQWSIGVLDVVAALQKMKAYAIQWHKEADQFVLCDNLEDPMFGLPDDLRQPEAAAA